jgi:hypothetical protein
MDRNPARRPRARGGVTETRDVAGEERRFVLVRSSMESVQSSTVSACLTTATEAILCHHDSSAVQYRQPLPATASHESRPSNQNHAVLPAIHPKQSSPSLQTTGVQPSSASNTSWISSHQMRRDSAPHQPVPGGIPTTAPPSQRDKGASQVLQPAAGFLFEQARSPPFWGFLLGVSRD